MRILVANESDVSQIGGVHTSILQITRHLAAKGHEMSILSINPGGLRDEEYLGEVRIHRISSKAARILYGFSPRVFDYLEEILEGSPRPDLVHSHGYNSLFSHEIAYVCRKKKIPYVISPHYSPRAHKHRVLGPIFSVGTPIGRLIFKGAGAIVCMSRFEADLVVRDFGVNSLRVQIIPNGVNSTNEHALAKPPHHKSGPLRLLYVGYLVKHKGIQYVLQMMPVLMSSHKLDANFRIVGEGPFEPQLRRMAKKLGIERRVKWEGALAGDELSRTYADSDLLLLLSQSENYGMVVAESLSLGTPVIVTSNSALSEFVSEPGCFGISHPPNINDLAALVADISSRPIDVGPFSSKIQSWHNVAKEYERVYRMVVEPGDGR